MKNVNIETIAQLCRYLLFGRSFVANQTDNQIILIFRDLSEKLELD